MVKTTSQIMKELDENNPNKEWLSVDELRKVLNKLSDKIDTSWDYHDALYDIEQVFFPSPKSPALKINKRGRGD